MPVTLAATVEALPGYPGFAFGLTCLALLRGSDARVVGRFHERSNFRFRGDSLSAAALYRGLRMLPVAQSFRETMGVCQ